MQSLSSLKGTGRVAVSISSAAVGEVLKAPRILLLASAYNFSNLLANPICPFHQISAP